MVAVKENKVYTLQGEQEKARYLKDGFDIYDDKGEIIEYSPLKMIRYSEYVKLQKENDALRKELDELKAPKKKA